MLPLYEDPCFTFRFAADRIIPRFHLEGVQVGRLDFLRQIENVRVGCGHIDRSLLLHYGIGFSVYLRLACHRGHLTRGAVEGVK